MRKSILATILFLFIAICANADGELPIYQGIRIDFHMEIFHKDTMGPRYPKAPLHIQAPDITLDGNSLFIYSNHPDYVLQLVSDDETVVFETYVSADTYQVELPSNLTGEYELQLQTESYAFVGYVEL